MTDPAHVATYEADSTSVRLPRGMDPDEFRSRKAAGDLRDIAHPDQTIRSFKARVLVRRLMLGRSHR